MVKFAPARDDSGREIQNLLDDIKILGGSVAVYHQTVTDVRDNQGSDNLGKDIRRKVVAEVGKGNEDAAALTREGPNMFIPGQMLIKNKTNIFYFRAGSQTCTPVRDFDGWESAQILSGAEGNKFKFGNVNFKAVRKA